MHSLDHVGVVVGDLKEAGAGFEALLGVPPERVRVPEVGLEALVFPVGGSAVEVLHFAGAVPGIDPRVFQPGPGVQHLAFRVPDLEAAHRRLAAAGAEVLRGFPRNGLHGRILFLAEPVSGVLLELVEVHGAGGVADSAGARLQRPELSNRPGHSGNATPRSMGGGPAGLP